MSVSEDQLREALRAVSREVEVFRADTTHAQHSVAHLRTRQVGRRRRRSVSALLAAAAVLAVAFGSVLVLADPRTPAFAPAGPFEGGNGWVALGSGEAGGGIHLVRPGEDARRLEGTGSERVGEACPVWSPDGTRLMFGRVTGSSDSTRDDAELVVVPVDQSGAAGTPTVLGLDGFEVLKGFDRHPCGTWAPDGRWVALAGGGEVWLVDVQTGETRRLPDLRPSDMEWRPGSDELAIAGDLGGNRTAPTLSTQVTVYSLSTGELRPLGSGKAAHITWSPDGTTLAYTAGENDPRELWLIDGDGRNARLLVADVGGVNHGIGPVWAPTGDRIAYQRLLPNGSEEHEVVLVNVTDGTETVIDPPETDGWVWYPSTVTWSPDGTTLLYTAWSFVDNGTDGRSGLLAVPAETPRDVTVLTDAVDLGPDPYGHQWAISQRWGRQPGG